MKLSEREIVTAELAVKLAQEMLTLLRIMHPEEATKQRHIQATAHLARLATKLKDHTS